MRITLNLGTFFHDHRSLVKLFISEKMRCIEDVENHISEIFKIKNFYLKSTNAFLPPSEDVRILNNDDIVWALPADNWGASFMENIIECEQSSKIKKKKKKDKEEEVGMEETPVNKKKKKSKKEKEIVEDLPPVSPPSKKKKKNEDVTQGRRNLETLLPQPETELSSTSTPNNLNGKKSNDDSSFERKHVQSLVNTFENRKPVNPIVNNESGKRINIVKTIIVSNKNNSISNDDNERKLDHTAEISKIDNPTVNDKNTQLRSEISEIISSDINNTDLHNSQNTEEISKQTNNNYLKSELNNVLKQHMNKLRNMMIFKNNHVTELKNAKCNNEHIENNCLNITIQDSSLDVTDETSKMSEPSVVESFTSDGTELIRQKRKRKRTHKRKRAPKTDEVNTNTNSFAFQFQPPVVKPVAEKPKIHVKFADEEQEEIVLDDSKIENNKEVLKDNKSEICNGPVGTGGNADLKKVKIDEEFVKCLLQQPVTKNTEPRVNDIIAFQVLRISEDYTPEVSSHIVGKVTNYGQDNKEVTFDIIYGEDQCVEPQGKFSLDPDQEEITTNTNESKYQCLWSSLIEPRLIYP